jgi:pimeloyl-ACP methyl ester carboxylesterase
MDNGSSAIVVIHGLWMHGLALGILRNRLAQRTEWPASAFSYRPVTRALPENARRLRRRIDEIDAATVHLVGHSLGGTLALQTLKRFPTEKVARVVCLGSPLVDSSAARNLGRWGWGRALLGRTVKEAVLEQPLRTVVDGHDVGVIAGTVGLGLGLFVGNLQKPHDGMVTLEETRLPGITDHLVTRVNHFGLVLSRTVAERTNDFLRDGAF